MLVGERPGKDEDRLGKPFVGLSGQELDRYLESVDMRREDIYVTNLVKVYAEHSPTSAEVAEWEGQLLEEMSEVSPRIIGAVGAHSAKWFLGDVNMEDIHGVPHNTPFGIVVPIYHPASAFYDPEQGKFIQYDMQMLAGVVKGEIEAATDEFPDPNYKVEPPWISPDADVVAIDTEGSRTRPWCLSWAATPGEAYCQRTVQTGWHNDLRLVLLHNSLHDLGVLATMGVHLHDDQFIDTMVLAYLLGVEPQGLKPLARRHAGMVMHSYTDVLAGANRSVALEYLYGLKDIDWGPTEPYALVINNELKVKQPWSINKYIDNIIKDIESGKRNKDGELVDPRKRWSNIEEYIRRGPLDLVGDMPEASLDDIPEDEAITYACRDADATLRVYPVLWNRVRATGQELVSKIDHAIIPMVDRMQHNGFAANPEHFRGLANRCDIIMAEEVAAIEELTGARINPNSPDQVRELLFDQLNLVPTKYTKGGKNGDSERKPSTQDKVLESLKGEHPVIDHITGYRAAAKVRDSFCAPILRLTNGANWDGRVRCNLRITRVSSGRLAANSPNLMAIPVREELGRDVRRGFIAPPGCVLATWDLNQIEMRHMAHESQDSHLLAVYADKGDLHSDTVGRLGIDRFMAKRINFGIITGITGMGLVDQCKLAGVIELNTPRGMLPVTEDVCDELIETWLGVYSGVRDYMGDCKSEARRYGFVRDMWGRIRHLPGVHSPIPRVREEACRQSHSHKIQAGAQGIMKVAMKAIWDALPSLWDAGYHVEPLLQIHDEIIFEMEDDDSLKMMMNDIVVDSLSTAHLQYFQDYTVKLGAKGAFGLNWGDLEK